MRDTAARIYTDVRDLSDRLTQLQRDRLLTLDNNPDGTWEAVQQALTLLDQAAEHIAALETLDL